MGPDGHLKLKLTFQAHLQKLDCMSIHLSKDSELKPLIQKVVIVRLCKTMALGPPTGTSFGNPKST